MEKNQISEKNGLQKLQDKSNVKENTTANDLAPLSPMSRRLFLGRLGGLTATAVGAGVVAWPSQLATRAAEAGVGQGHCVNAPLTGGRRAAAAYRVRLAAARYEREHHLPDHQCNGDESYANKIASYSKGLPHDDLGEVDLPAYEALTAAMRSGDPADFEKIPLGGSRKLVNPQSALAYELSGPDPQKLTQPPPPCFASAEEAGEIAENYWMALTRDVPFSEYGAHRLTHAAAADLTNFSDFRGPREHGRVTPNTLFRGSTPGELIGPHISQLLWKNIPYGPLPLVQRYRTLMPNAAYLVTYEEWLAHQNGAAPGPVDFDPTFRYVRNGRDLGEWVRLDFTYQAFLHAALILSGLPGSSNPGNPYNESQTQVGQATFGRAHLLDLLARVANVALKVVWFQKWSVHRRLRPEAFGGRIHNLMTKAADYPIHSDILNSPVLDRVFSRYGSYLLPQAHPDGSPTHPAYGGGHATISGACATVLKAFFDESQVIPDPVVASADGTSLVPFKGPDLTIGGELNKLAANISFGRNIAGIHWRSDATESLKLGEEIAIHVLRELRLTYNETFKGFSLTTLDGRTITV